MLRQGLNLLCAFALLAGNGVSGRLAALIHSSVTAGGIPLAPTAAAPQTGVSLSAEQKEITVGDPLQLTLEVRHPAGTQAILPQVQQVWQGFSVFEVRSQSRPTTQENADGSRTTRAVITLVLFAPGEHSTPPLSVSISDNAGSVHEQSVPALTIKVNSVLKEGDTMLRDLKPQAEMSAAPFWLWAAGAGLIALALAGLLWWGWARRRKKERQEAHSLPDTRPAWLVAVQDLERIEGLRLLEKGEYKEYYTLVSDCLRRYLENQMHVPALERTTAEIRHDLKGTDLPARQAALVLEMFSESDLVKFARFVPDGESAPSLIQRGRAFVEETKPDEPAL